MDTRPILHCLSAALVIGAVGAMGACSWPPTGIGLQEEDASGSGTSDFDIGQDDETSDDAGSDDSTGTDGSSDNGSDDTGSDDTTSNDVLTEAEYVIRLEALAQLAQNNVAVEGSRCVTFGSGGTAASTPCWASGTGRRSPV